MNARIALVAVAVAALALAAWFFLRDDARTAAAQPTAEPGAEVTRPAQQVTPIDAPPVELEPRSDVSVTPKVVESSPPAASTAKELAPDVEGTLAVERAGGTSEPAAQAQFQLLFWSSNFTKYVDVEVRDGRWSASFPDDAKGKVTGLEITHVKVGERDAVVRSPQGQIAFPTAGLVTIVAGFPDSTILRVVGADTGRDLTDVDLVPTEGLFDDLVHPGANYEKRALAKGVASPVDLLALGGKQAPGVRELRVHAPGYAWTKVALDTRTGGERTVELQPGGSLRLSVVDNSGSKGVQLRFRRASSDPMLSMRAAAGDVLLDGFEPGPLAITAEIGEWFRDPLKLGTVETEVAAGSEARATLTIDPAPTADTASAGGVVVVPPEWKIESLRLSLDFVGTRLDGRSDWINVEAKPADPEPNGNLVFAWSHPKLQVGRYELKVFKPQWSTLIEVPAGGRNDFRCELPPLAEVAVRAVDAVTGEDADIPRLMWNCKRPEGVTGGSLDNAEFDPATKLHTLRCPAGAIELTAFGGGYEHTTESLTVVPGHQEHTFRIHRATTIDIVLRDGDAPVPFPDDWIAGLEFEDGKRVLGGATISATTRGYSLPGAGRYRVKFPPINGYQPIPDQMVDAQEGKNVRIDVALTKIR